MSRIAAWLPLRMSVSQLKRFNDPITPRLSVTLVCSGPGFFGQYSIASGAFLYYSRRNSSASEIRLKPRSGMLHEREGEQVAPASLQTVFWSKCRTRAKNFPIFGRFFRTSPPKFRRTLVKPRTGEDDSSFRADLEQSTSSERLFMKFVSLGTEHTHRRRKFDKPSHAAFNLSPS